MGKTLYRNGEVPPLNGSILWLGFLTLSDSHWWERELVSNFDRTPSAHIPAGAGNWRIFTGYQISLKIWRKRIECLVSCSHLCMCAHYTVMARSVLFLCSPTPEIPPTALNIMVALHYVALLHCCTVALLHCCTVAREWMIVINGQSHGQWVISLVWKRWWSGWSWWFKKKSNCNDF